MNYLKRKRNDKEDKQNLANGKPSQEIVPYIPQTEVACKLHSTARWGMLLCSEKMCISWHHGLKQKIHHSDTHFSAISSLMLQCFKTSQVHCTVLHFTNASFYNLLVLENYYKCKYRRKETCQRKKKDCLQELFVKSKDESFVYINPTFQQYACARLQPTGAWRRRDTRLHLNRPRKSWWKAYFPG